MAPPAPPAHTGLYTITKVNTSVSSFMIKSSVCNNVMVICKLIIQIDTFVFILKNDYYEHGQFRITKKKIYVR